VEGPSADPAIRAARDRDRRALLATLFASRGTIMLTAGDEFGRSQAGNNNAYAQDNAITWLDWDGRDRALEDFCAELSALRRAVPELSNPWLLTGEPEQDGTPDVIWLTPDGTRKTTAHWTDAEGPTLAMVLARRDGGGRIAVLFNRGPDLLHFRLPRRPGFDWQDASVGTLPVPGRSVAIVTETARPEPARHHGGP
jgi:glycogen operon protein